MPAKGRAARDLGLGRVAVKDTVFFFYHISRPQIQGMKARFWESSRPGIRKKLEKVT